MKYSMLHRCVTELDRAADLSDAGGRGGRSPMPQLALSKTDRNSNHRPLTAAEAELATRRAEDDQALSTESSVALK